MEEELEYLELDDMSKDLLVLNKITIEKLFETKNENVIALYLFYYKTAKWQGTNQVFANDSYVRKCLGWGSKKVTETKNILKDMKLIESLQVRKGNRIGGWYIKVNYFSDFKNTHFEELQKSTSSKQETNALNKYIKCLENKIEILNKEKDNNKLLSKKKKDFVPPTLEEIKAYCEEKHSNVDPKAFYDYFTETNWVDSSGKKVKSWKGKILTWSSYRGNIQQPKKKTHAEEVEEMRERFRKLEEEENETK